MSIPNTDRSRKYGVSIEYGDIAGTTVTSLPQKIALFAQGNTASTFTEGKRQILDAVSVANLAGYGSPAHLTALELFPDNGRIGVGSIPVDLFLFDDDASGVAALYTLSAATAASADMTIKVKIGGIETKEISITSADTADEILGFIKTAINNVLKIPVIAGTVATGDLPLTYKCTGKVGNNLDIQVLNVTAGAVDESTFSGTTFSIVATTAGSNSPDITTTINAIGDDWYTNFIIATDPYTETATLDIVKNFIEGRFQPLIKKYCTAYWGTNDDYDTRVAITDARKLDYSNSVTSFKDAPEQWHVLSARNAALVAFTANTDPARNYNNTVTGISVGDSSKEDDSVRENALQKGCGAASLFNGEWKQHNTITMSHPDGVDNPPFRYPRDITVLANIVYGLDQVVGAQRLKGLPLLSDNDQVVSSNDFIRPRDMVGFLKSLADQQNNALLITDVDYTKDNMTVSINSTNPKRLDIFYPVRITGSAEIFDTTLQFAFYFGQ